MLHIYLTCYHLTDVLLPMQSTTAALSRCATAVTTAQSGCKYKCSKCCMICVTIPLLRSVCDQIQSFMVTINLHLYIVYQHIDELKAIYLFWEKLTTDNKT